MATLQDIADRLNISKGTVSKALNGAPDISETLQKPYWKQLLKWDIQNSPPEGCGEKLCILIET